MASDREWQFDASEFVPSWMAELAPTRLEHASPLASNNDATNCVSNDATNCVSNSAGYSAAAGRRFRAACQFGGEMSGHGARALAADSPAALRIALSYTIGTPRWSYALAAACGEATHAAAGGEATHAAAGGETALDELLGTELAHLLHVAVGRGDATAARAVAAAVIAAARAAPDPGASMRAAVMPLACAGCRVEKFSGGGWLAHWLVVGRARPAVMPTLRKLQKKYCDMI